MSGPIHTNWLEVDLGAIRSNYRRLQEISGRPVMPVIKANAYGHGIVPVAKVLEKEGAEWFGVARIEEALQLRQAGISGRILVLGSTQMELAGLAAQEHISLTVYSPENAFGLAQAAAASGHNLCVHVKVDTGMGRLGITPGETLEMFRQLSCLPSLTVEGMFTHFARADEPDVPLTLEQISRFDEALEAVRAAGYQPGFVHASNSAGVINFPQARYDMSRCGIALYGLEPGPQTPLPEGFRPALAWNTTLASIRKMPAFAGISYGHRYVTRQPERIGTLAVGYADGFRRQAGNSVLIRGKKAPVVGTICMDQCMISLEGIPEAQVGDEVVLIGQQSDSAVRAEEMAALWNTINYEVVSGITARVPRIYIE